MSKAELSSTVVPSEATQSSSSLSSETGASRSSVNRRSFLKGGVVAGAATVGAGLLASRLPAFAQQKSSSASLSAGDIAILRFLAAAELIETDLWQQYAELGGVTSGSQNTYQMALQQLDGDGSQYITSNTLDEASHANFLDAYLKSKGAAPV